MSAAAALLALALAPAARAASTDSWHHSELPHFRLNTESRFAPPGFGLTLERIHSRLALELAALAPWMAKEKMEVDLYASSASYAAGEFAPPPWSNGLSLVEARVVALPDRVDRDELSRTLAHEMTHVLFESYFKEKGKEPPVWLTEGLAMLMETAQVFNDGSEDKTPWGRALFTMLEPRPIAEFAGQEATEQRSRESVDYWYLQAYGTVRFLARQHSRLQFRLFCQKLRDTQDLDGALWSVYRYRDSADFDRAFLAWLRQNGSPAGRQKTGPQRPARLNFNRFERPNGR